MSRELVGLAWLTSLLVVLAWVAHASQVGGTRLARAAVGLIGGAAAGAIPGAFLLLLWVAVAASGGWDSSVVGRVILALGFMLPIGAALLGLKVATWRGVLRMGLRETLAAVMGAIMGAVLALPGLLLLQHSETLSGFALGATALAALTGALAAFAWAHRTSRRPTGDGAGSPPASSGS